MIQSDKREKRNKFYIFANELVFNNELNPWFIYYKIFVNDRLTRDEFTFITSL